MATKILVIQDTSIADRAIVSQLQQLGYLVTDRVPNVLQALAKAAETQPDVVLMDIGGIADLDDIATAEQIRQQFHIPVICLISDCDRETLQQSNVTQAFGYVIKPFNETQLCVAIEISLYKHQMERALQQCEAELQKLNRELKFTHFALDRVGDSIAIVDSHAHFIYVNQSACQKLNYSKEELLSLSVADIHSNYSLELWQKHWQSLKETQNLTFNSIYRDRSGCEFSVKVSVNYLEVEGQAYGCAIAHDENINLLEYKQTQERLTQLLSEEKAACKQAQESRQYLANILESMNDAFVSLDREWRYTYVNKKAGELFNRRPKDLIGKNIWEEFPEGVRHHFYKVYYKAAKERIFIQLEEYYPPWNCWLENRIYPTEDGLAIFFQDVTERKQQEATLRWREEQLRLTFNFAKIGSWDWNPNTGEVDWNENTAELLGLTPGTFEIAYQTWRDRVHPEDIDRVESALFYALETHTDFEAEYRLLWRERTVRWILAKGLGLYDEAGQAVRMLGAIVDISDRKHAEEELQQAYRKLNFHVENSPLAVVEWDNNLRVRRWSKKAERIFGWKAEEVMGKSPYDWHFIHEEDTKIFNQNIARLFELGSPQNLNSNRNYTKDGAVIYCQWYASAMHDEDGNLVSVLSLAQDITGQIKAEQERDRLFRQRDRKNQNLEAKVQARTGQLVAELIQRQKAEATLQRLVEGTAAFTGEHFFAALVQNLARTLNVRHVLVTKRCDGQLQTLAFWSDDRLQTNIIYNIADTPCEISLDRGTYFCPFRVREQFPDDPELVTMKAESCLAIALLDSSGQPLGNLCIVDDKPLANPSQLEGILRVFAARAAAELERQQAIEALQQSEERFRTSVENMLDGFAIFSAIRDDSGQIVDFRYEYINQTGCRSLYLEREKVLGQRLCEVFPIPQKIGLFEEYCCLVETGQPLIKESLIYRCNRGKQRLNLVFDFQATKLGDGFAVAWRDVTARKQAEQALRDSESKYRSLVSNIPGAIYRCLPDERWTLIFVSDEIELITGYCASDFLQKKIMGLSAIIHSEDRPSISKLVKNAIARQEPYLFEYRIFTADGSIKWVYEKGQGWWDENGKLQYLDGVIFDLNDRKQAELALHESQQLLRLVIDNIPLEIFWKDRNSIFLGCNRLLAMNAGVGTPENIIGKSDYELAWSPQEANWFREWDARVMETNTPEYHIIEPRHQADNTTRWLETNKIPMHDDRGNVIGILGTVEDITERLQQQEALRESEQKFRQLAENIDDVFWITNVDKTQLIYVSPSHEKIWGRSIESLYASPSAWLDAIHSEDRDRVIAAISQQREGRYDEEYRIVRPDGEIRWIRDRAFPIADENGKIYRIAGICEDISDRKQAEAQLQASLAEKEVLLKEIHHRVKNNLNVIYSLLNMQLRYIKDETLQNLLNDSQKRIQTMALIHEQLYQSQSLSKIDFAEYINRLVRNSCAASNPNPSLIQVEIQAEPVALNLETAIPTGLIINELLTNSLKHAFPPGHSGTIWVSFQRTPEDKLHLRISDNGKGLPSELNLHNTSSLGMRLVHILVQQLRGAFEVESTQGTRFDLTFDPI